MSGIELSVVVPCYNEAAVLDALATELRATLAPLVGSFEVILVDDGSSDSTLDRLRQLSAGDDRFRYIALSRNFGKEAAMLAGLSQAAGAAVAIIDADLQHPPALLGEMLPYLSQGYDQVVAKRNRAGDPRARTLASKVYYRMVNALIDVELEDGVGDFRIISRDALRALLSLGESNRFSKGLFAWIGFDTKVVEYENVARAGGASKWSMRALFNYGIDSVISFNNRPLRLAIHLGVAFSTVAFVYALWILIAALFHKNPVPGYVTIISALVGFGGIQMILLGIIGEYLGRIYIETKSRPHFLMKETSEGPGSPVAVALGPEREQQASDAATLGLVSLESSS